MLVVCVDDVLVLVLMVRMMLFDSVVRRGKRRWWKRKLSRAREEDVDVADTP
jgi:hypothetical protein